MRELIRRFNHRDAVMKHLDALLIFYPPKRQFATDFPTLKETIRADFVAGLPAAVSALGVAQRILDGFCGQLGDEEKAKALDALLESGRARFAEGAKRRLDGAREIPGERAVFVTQLCGGALYMAARMREEGTLRRDEYEGFAAAIAAALGSADAPLGGTFQ